MSICIAVRWSVYRRACQPTSHLILISSLLTLLTVHKGHFRYICTCILLMNFRGIYVHLSSVISRLGYIGNNNQLACQSQQDLHISICIMNKNINIAFCCTCILFCVGWKCTLLFTIYMYNVLNHCLRGWCSLTIGFLAGVSLHMPPQMVWCM